MQRMMNLVLIIVVLSAFALATSPRATMATFTSPLPPPARPPIQICCDDECVCRLFERFGRERDDGPAVIAPTPRPVMRVIAPARMTPVRWRMMRVHQR